MSFDIDTITDEPLDPEIVERMTSTRRDALRTGLGRAGRALAAGSVPVAFASQAATAFGQGNMPKQVTDILNFALTLEYLESTYYDKGVGTSGLIPSSDQVIFKTIRDDEQAHVKGLKQALGSQAIKKPKFDFTAGGMFTPFKDYSQFKLLSQAFEDTGVRAYKGQAPKLLDAPDILTVALTIHSVEARHAAVVRLLNKLQAWIPEDQPGINKAAAAVYAGMDKTTQFGVDLTKVTQVSPKQITEAFDEPLDMAAVLKIAKPFLAS